MSVKPKDLKGIRPPIDDADHRPAHRAATETAPTRQFRDLQFRNGTRIYRSATSGIFAVLVGVVALSLVVGGVVIMNIMLMVVTERTREIGLRKALGARRADIMTQMLTDRWSFRSLGGWSEPLLVR